MKPAQADEIINILVVVLIFLLAMFTLVMLHVLNHWKDR